MDNITIEKQDKWLVIKIDTTQAGRTSNTGKSKLLACSHGFAATGINTPEGKPITLSLNASYK